MALTVQGNHHLHLLLHVQKKYTRALILLFSTAVADVNQIVDSSNFRICAIRVQEERMATPSVQMTALTVQRRERGNVLSVDPSDCPKEERRPRKGECSGKECPHK